MNPFSHVPPGFRFHPTDEELVDYYLRKKIASRQIDVDIIKEVDLYKIEPWDLQELCRIGTDEQSDWIFFSHKDKKYPTGTRTNRATKLGFWKATGRDKAIHSKHGLIGMRKTLVFYKGRAPNGLKTDWIMHEYRLESNEHGIPREEGWVVCKVFKKKISSTQRMDDPSCNWYEDMFSVMARELETAPPSPKRFAHTVVPPIASYNYLPCKQELELGVAASMCHNPHPNHDPSLLPLPQLESPTVQQSACAYTGGITMPSASINQEEFVHQTRPNFEPLYGRSEHISDNQAAEWMPTNAQLGVEEIAEYTRVKCAEFGSSSCQIDLWR